MNMNDYMKESKEYVEIMKKYETKEEKIKYLEECEWQINMIDRWTQRDRICYEVVKDLINYLKENTIKNENKEKILKKLMG